MKAITMLFLAAAPVAGRVDALKSYKAMPTETDPWPVIAAMLLVLVVFLAIALAKVGRR